MRHLPLTTLILLVIVSSSTSWANVKQGNAQQADKQPSTGFFYGKVSAEGLPVKGAMISFYHGQPVHSLSIFADNQGRFLSPELPWTDSYTIRIRRAGWRDVLLQNQKSDQNGQWTAVKMERIKDPNEMIQQLPANYWLNLVLEEIKDRDQILEFKLQCTYCHQQGTPLTSRRQFTREQWVDIIHEMGRRGGILSTELREALPDHYLKAYDNKNIMAKLSQYDGENGPLPVPSATARQAVIEEWDLGGPYSGHHDMMVYHPDGSIWSVDGPTDTLHSIRFDSNPDGVRKSFKIPHGNHKQGGIYWKMAKLKGEKNYLEPHSLQTAPNGVIWVILSYGNQLGGFNPQTETWDIVDLEQGMNPHTLRFDKKGRMWYTITATNHVGMFDPTTREQKFVRLKAPGFLTDILLRVTPFLIRHADWFQLRERSATADGVTMPMPYGLDINPVDGSVWYSQLNMSHIGRIDPETLEVTSIETPFYSPRRLRFDSKGGLWVPSYSEASIHLYDTQAMTWKKSWQIPIEPIGTDVPYAVFVDHKTDHVWITGTQSDTIIRFAPETEQFTVIPLPTRVTFTREFDMDKAGNVWTSHSSYPTWHMEGGIPKVTRVDPDGAPDISASGLFTESRLETNKITSVGLQ